MNIATHPFDALMEITARPPTVFVRGEGSFLWDDSGKRYLDFIQGWAVNCLGHSPPDSRRSAGGAGKTAADAEPGVLQRPEPQAGQGADRSQLLRPGVLRQFRRGSQRRRDQARAQIRRAAPERRLRDHHLRGRLPRPDAGDHVGLRQEGLRAAVRAEGAGLSQGAAQRSRLGQAADHRQDHRRDAGADPGRSRRLAGDRSVPARVARR